MASLAHDFAIWKPFTTPKEPPRQLLSLFSLLIKSLTTSSQSNPPKSAFQRTATAFLETYGAIRRGDFIEPWMEHELSTIFTEAIDPYSSQNPETGARFFTVNPTCVHSDTCLCHLSINPNAGIPYFPNRLTHMGRQRKDSIKRMHDLLVQFLILFASAGREALNVEETEVARQLIAFTDPSEQLFLQSSKFLDIEDDRRSRYIGLDSVLQSIKSGIFRHGDYDDGSDDDRDAVAHRVPDICAVLGRRILVLSVAFKGIGYLFAKRLAVQYWDLQNLLSDISELPPYKPISISDHKQYLLSDARASAEQKKYPLRVINTHTLELETDTSVFRDNYAILSHTWTQNGMEVLYKDVRALLERGRSDNDEGQMYTPPEKKLLSVIDQCRQLNYPYVWIDNCLIDKENIPELNESLPNMGDWYANSAICVIYLEDFTGMSLNDDKAMKTRWATRGWTLQETVMSPRAKFFNKDWVEIGDTEDILTRPLLARISHVPENMLCCGGPPNSAASLVLQLAATRKTFKPEDRAYSLLSMLRVRITVDYGEGSASAMSRLFSAILRTTGDVTIFNWSGKLLQSPGHGRSLYPVDYTAFQHVPPAQKPAFTMSPIRVDYVGVHARFDVIEFEEVTIGYDNEETLDMVKRLDKALRNTNKLGSERSDVTVSAYGALGHGDGITLDVLCPLHEVRDMLDGRKRWVLARFAGLDKADWWLCGMEKIMDGLETRGRRISTDELEQSIVPKDKRLYRQVDMWIG